jgi:hypothetical protein
MTMIHDALLQSAVNSYQSGEPVPTRYVAGLGAAYELVTQCLLWESLCLIAVGLDPVEAVNRTASALKSMGYSGAQVIAVREHAREIYARGLSKWLPPANSDDWKLHARWWPECPFPPSMPG